MADWGGLENRCGPQGPPWVRIPPPPLQPRSPPIKIPDSGRCQEFDFNSMGDWLYQLLEFLFPARRTRRINDMVNNPAPVSKIRNDCQIKGLKTGETIREVLSTIWW